MASCRAVLVILSALLSGCYGPNMYVRPTDNYLPSYAYLYGRFYIEGQTMSFVVLCRDGTTYNIPFSSTDEVQLIMFAPSTCQLDQVVYGRVAHQMARFRLIRNEILDPGGVYYVGDFRMSGTSRITDWNFFYTTWTSTWHTDSTRDNYQATTEAMKAQFPQFASVDTENRVTH